MEIVKLPKEIEEKAKLIGNVFTALEKIEELVSSDFCQDMEWKAGEGELSERETKMEEIIGKVYMISHSMNPKHECFDVHESWRSTLLK